VVFLVIVSINIITNNVKEIIELERLPAVQPAHITSNIVETFLYQNMIPEPLKQQLPLLNMEHESTCIIHESEGTKGRVV